MNTKKLAIFLDRDGVINNSIDRGPDFEVAGKKARFTAPFFYSEFCLKPGVEDVLRKMGELGYLRILVTNQPDRAYGLMTEEEHQKIMADVKKLPLDDIYICPHTRYDNCDCKKPKPGMLVEGAKKWDVDLSQSYMIGDTKSDMETGKAAGCTAILIDCQHNAGLEADIHVPDLASAFTVIAERALNMK